MTQKLCILVDADDVCIDHYGMWVTALNQKYGTSVTPEDIKDWDVTKAFPTLTRSQIFGVLETPEFWTLAKAVPGSQEYLQRLHEEGHKIYVVTATDFSHCGAKVQVLLELNPFLDKQHILIAYNKQMICGDVLIDNYERNLIGGDYFRILFEQPHNRNFNEQEYGMHRAKTWDDVYRLIHSHLLNKE